jgi:two-component system response regulator HydG
LKRIAPTDATVLIQGETGTGKELFAQAVHQNSPRKIKPFVALNCGALSEHILESEFFGHVRGAFTDALADRIGKFEYASGGTIFLDEVGDMPKPTQIKLLRVLENGEITRLGTNDVRKVNVRILSATNRNLEDAVKAGTFRQDLYHRLKVVTLRIPPLRERKMDIPVLLDHFMKHFSARYNKKINGITRRVRKILFDYDWLGNVRQLRNVAESMLVVDYDGMIDIDDLPEELGGILTLAGESGDAEAGEGEDIGDEIVNEFLSAKSILGTTIESGERIEQQNVVDKSDEKVPQLAGMTMDEIERLAITQTLEKVGGNREKTKKMLKISERTLYRRLKELKEHLTK